ncbi:MAG: metal-dependent transcriptional regulator [Clostridia bacterium]|nr:metal-dependent transcriptional regulator [Clostridia bacterium]
MALQESGEMYLESIYMLSKEKSDVHAVDVSEYLGYTKPSVSRAMGILKNGGYIIVDRDGHIRLTDEGRKVAEAMYERHTLLTKFLISIGVDEETATEDACKIEHVISEKSFEAMKKHIK